MVDNTVAKQAVLVTTEHRGVFFGYIEPGSGDSAEGGAITLYRARNCLYWSDDVKGVFGLAADGPSKSCRVGPSVPKLQLHKITSVADVSSAAVEKWEASPWGR